jgi:hypothetical protein
MSAEINDTDTFGDVLAHDEHDLAQSGAQCVIDRVVVSFQKVGGAPEKIRTSDLQLRRLPLYPAELRARSSSLALIAAG